MAHENKNNTETGHRRNRRISKRRRARTESSSSQPCVQQKDATPTRERAVSIHSPDSSRGAPEPSKPTVPALATVSVALCAGAAARTCPNTDAGVNSQAGGGQGDGNQTHRTQTETRETHPAAQRAHFAVVVPSVESCAGCDINGTVAKTSQPSAGCLRQTHKAPEPELSTAEPYNNQVLPHAWCQLIPPPQARTSLTEKAAKAHRQACEEKHTARSKLVGLPDGPLQADVDSEAFPFVHPSGAPQKDSEHGKQVPATREWLRTATMPTVAEPPVTAPRKTEDEPVWPEKVPYPFPAQLASTAGKWRLVQRWYREYQSEFAKTVRQGKRKRFNYKNVIGGKHGLVIKNFLSTDYHGIDLSQWQWDLREYWESGGTLPAKPLKMQTAQDNSDWDLAQLKKDALAAGFKDLHLLQQLCVEGFSSYSSQLRENTVVLCCNYKGAQEHAEFVKKDVEKRRTEYEKPRIRGGWHGVPFLNCKLFPISVAEQVSILGDIKLRITRDPGAPREPVLWVQPEPEEEHEEDGEHRFEATEEDVSLNGGVDLTCETDHPLARYATVDAHARAAAVLHASGCGVVQWKSDLSAFFNQLALHTRDVPSNVQFSDPEKGIEEILRLEFGNTQNPAQAQRTSLLLLYLANKELQELQQRYVDEGKVPSTAREWIKEREAAGERTDFYFISTFIDDTMALALDFFQKDAEQILTAIFYRYGVELADGTWDSFNEKFRKDKFERSDVNGPLECLGVQIIIAGEGGRNLTEKRAEMYAASGETLLTERRVQPQPLQEFLGRVSFTSQSVVGIGPLFRALLSCLPKSWAGVMDADQKKWKPPTKSLALTARAKAVLAELCTAIRKNEPTALWPMEDNMGEQRELTWVFGDAARKEDAPPDQFVGMGGFIHLQGTDTVYYMLERWPRKMMESLDITSLEHFTSSALVQAAAELHRALGVIAPQDILVISDNEGASKYVGQSGKARSAPLRALAAARLRNPGHRPRDRAVHVHSRRQYNTESDDLSKGKVEAFKAGIKTRFGREMHCVQLPSTGVQWHVLAEAAAIADAIALKNPKNKQEHHNHELTLTRRAPAPRVDAAVPVYAQTSKASVEG